jgi:hypothetical protein
MGWSLRNLTMNRHNRSDFELALDDEMQRALLIAEPLPLEQAQAEFDELKGKIDLLITEREDLRFAFSAERCGPPPLAASVEIKARFDRFKKLVKARPNEAQKRIEEIEGELGEAEPKLQISRERLQLAKEVRAAALGETFRPRHRQAVKAIASALETLSKAVAAEQDIQFEFRSAAPGFSLPDMGIRWRFVLLNDPKSSASVWVRQAKAAELLDG